MSTAEAPQQPGPSVKPDQRPTTRRKVAPPAHHQATRNPRKASKHSWDGRPREEGPSGLPGSTSDRGTGGGFGSTMAVCHLADSHHLVNKRAVSFFSGSHMQRSWPSHLRWSNAETMHQNLFGHRHSVSSRSDAKVLSLSQLDACWQTHVPSSVGGACDRSCRQSAVCVTGRFTSYHSTFHSAQLQEPCPRYVKHGSFETIGRVSGCLVNLLQSLPIAPQNHSARLCNSVRQVPAQVQGHSVYLSTRRECCCTSGGGCNPSQEGCNWACPPGRNEERVLQPVLHCTQEGLILDLRTLNRALPKLPFRMLTLKHILTCGRGQDWFVAIDLKDAYFHVSILPRHRPFLRFVFEGQAYQYKVLPFRLSLSPRVFTKIAEAALAPLREVGICILNYLDDWLILAHSRELVCAHRDMVLDHLARLGLRVNCEKSKLSPVQSIFFSCGIGLGYDDCTPLSGSCSVGAEMLDGSQAEKSGPSQKLSEAPGAYAILICGHAAGLDAYETASALASYRVPRWAWHHSSHRVNITPLYHRTFSPWEDISFLWAGVPLEQVSRHIVVTTDASKTGWGAVCNGHAASEVWTGPRLHWHINCLELLTVLFGLEEVFDPYSKASMCWSGRTTQRQSHTSTTRVVFAPIACHNSPAISTLEPAQTQGSTCHSYPGDLNRVADLLSQQVSLRSEWRLHPQTADWRWFGQAQVDLFASSESTHCQLWYSLTEAPLGTDALAHSWPRGLLKYAFPAVSLIAQTQAPYWPNRTWFSELVLMASVPPWRIPLRRYLLSQGKGTI